MEFDGPSIERTRTLVLNNGCAVRKKKTSVITFNCPCLEMLPDEFRVVRIKSLGEDRFCAEDEIRDKSRFSDAKFKMAGFLYVIVYPSKRLFGLSPHPRYV